MRAHFSWYLAGSLYVALVSFAMLPISTRVLGPADFGLAALANALVGFGVLLSSLGSFGLLSERFALLDSAERGRLISAQLLLSLSVGGAYLAIMFALSEPLGRLVPDLSLLNAAERALLAVATILAVPSTIAATVMILSDRPRGYVALVASQATIAAVALVGGLFLWNMGLTALFLSTAVGAAAQAVAALFLLRSYLRTDIDARSFRMAIRAAPAASLSNLLESIQTLVERALLSGFVGLATLGLYNHSQQYRNLMNAGVKAVARSVYSSTLREAHAGGDFRLTKLMWEAVFIGLTFAGLAFAFVGPEVIGILTNGKFNPAAHYAAVWMAYLLIQNSGRPEVALLFTSGRSDRYFHLSTVATVVGIAGMFLLVPALGVEGVLIALFAQLLIVRVVVRKLAHSIRKVPFQDRWVLIGTLLIFGSLWSMGIFQPAPLTRALCLVAIAAIMVIRYAKPLGRLLRPSLA